jgi:hypothetical protein
MRKFMKLLALEKECPGIKPGQFLSHLRAEAERIWELYQAGVIRELYFNQEGHTAVLVLECEDFEAARSALNTLPLVVEGIIEFEIISLIPYTGFSRLFANAPQS